MVAYLYFKTNGHMPEIVEESLDRDACMKKKTKTANGCDFGFHL